MAKTVPGNRDTNVVRVPGELSIECKRQMKEKESSCHAEDHLQRDQENLLQLADKGALPFDREKTFCLSHLRPRLLGKSGS